MVLDKQWPSGSDNPTPTNFKIPQAGEKNWASLTNFLVALAGGTQATTFQKIAIRQATTTPITVASNDCLVSSKLTTPGTVIVNLPAGVAKQIYYIYDETGDASTNNITINRSGTDTIEGATSLVVNTDKELVGLAFDSTSGDWKVFVRCRPNISVGSISGLGVGVAAWLADPTSAKLATAVTDETGSGLLVFNNGPTFVTPAIGTPSSGVLTNCTGLPISSLVGSTTGSGALVFATSPTLVTPAIGTPSSGTLSNCGGLPLTTGVTGILPIAKGGTNGITAIAGFDNLSPTTTKGDLVTRNGSNNVRLPVGTTDGQVLGVDSAESTGLKWIDAGGGAGEINAVSNPSAASNTTGYTAGTSHTVTRDTSNSPLDPTIDTCLDISASATVAESSTSGVYYSISTLPEAIRNWKLKVEFFVDVPASDEWSLSVYDGTTRLSLSTDNDSNVTVLPSGFTGRFSAYFNSTSNASYSVNFTCTSYSSTTNLYVTNLVAGPGIGQAGAAVGPAVPYTPTITGFGTPTNVEFTSARLGEYLYIQGKFTSGTTTAVEAQIGLPSGLSIAMAQSATSLVGQVAPGLNTNQIFYSLATSGDAFINVSRIIPAGSTNPLTPVNGNSVAASGQDVSINAKVRISDYVGKGIIPMLAQDNLSNWTDISSLSWANSPSWSTEDIKYKRIGDDLEIKGTLVASGAGSAGTFYFQLPLGYTFDEDKISGTATSSQFYALGYGGWSDSGTSFKTLGLAQNNSTNQVAFAVSTADSIGFLGGNSLASGDQINFRASIPIIDYAGSQNSLVGYSEASDNSAGLGQAFNNVSVVRLHTTNGYGSTNTQIRRFTTAVTNTGSDITYVDSATNGAFFTINTTGIYAISITDVQASGADYSTGISLNSTQLTTAIQNITAADRLAHQLAFGSDRAFSCSWSGKLNAGDVIRPHAENATVSSNAVLGNFSITRIR